ncbi:MAG: hypothetical protein RR248_04055 [Clostridia bacterium]
MKDYLVEIYDDVFGVAPKIRSIDNYLVAYNPAKSRYEIRNGVTKRIELIIPYSCLDQRSIELVYRTRKENSDSVFAEIERNNQNIEKIKRQNIEKDIEKILEKEKII